MNTKYEVLNQSLRRDIQNSGLEVGGVYYILKVLMNDVEKLYYAQLNNESMEVARQASTPVNNSESEEPKTETELEESVE